MNDTLLVPHFARLAEYFGLWCIEPRAAQGLYQTLRSVDLAAHVRSSLGQPQKVETPLQLLPGKGKSQIGLVQIAGTMMKGQSSLGGASTIAARRAIRQAAADPNVSGILLAIDSPGGTSAGTADLAADVKAASRKKPVYAQIEDTAASAAYWVAAVADKVFANDATALVGNVGTYILMEDSSAAGEKTGVKEIAFSSGPLKVFGGGLGINEAQTAHMQGIVDAIQAEFTAAVKSGRGLSDARMEKVLSGAIFPASEALKLGLLDGIQRMDATVSMLASAK